MRTLASIQKIAALSPIEGADKIEVATILGWQVVVKKGEFTVGDSCVYIEIDSIVPELPVFEFLRERKFRVRTIKLRKQVSQGLALPVNTFRGLGSLSVGADVTEVLQVKKYDPQAEQEAKIFAQEQQLSKNRLGKFLSRYAWYRRLFYRPVRAPFPKFIQKTDETRIQNMPDILTRCGSNVFDVTEKLDGQSATYFMVRKKSFFGLFTSYVFGVCSRNFQLLKEDNSSYWTIARQLHIKHTLRVLLEKAPGAEYVVLQGEIIGKNIQGNKYQIDGYDFYAFNLKYSNCCCSTRQTQSALIGYGILTVPLAESILLPPTVNELVEYSKGKSVIGAKPIREGLVIRNHRNNISFKVINPDFLLKNDE